MEVARSASNHVAARSGEVNNLLAVPGTTAVSYSTAAPTPRRYCSNESKIPVTLHIRFPRIRGSLGAIEQVSYNL
jgi:hypothetical protein